LVKKKECGIDGPVSWPESTRNSSGISGAENTLLSWIALGPDCVQPGYFVEGGMNTVVL
jgi:hypothetical protein